MVCKPPCGDWFHRPGREPNLPISVAPHYTLEDDRPLRAVDATDPNERKLAGKIVRKYKGRVKALRTAHKQLKAVRAFLFSGGVERGG